MLKRMVQLTVAVAAISVATAYAENQQAPCASGSSTCQSIWTMSPDKKPQYNNHGRAFISCDSARDVVWNDNTLTVKYHHVQGDESSGHVENTCYVGFSNIFTQSQTAKRHGYVTANITINGNPSIKDQIWPAFWLVGPSWPTYGEIDQAEYMAKVQGSVTHNNLNGGPSWDQNHSKAIANYNKLGLGDINQNHQYGIEWQLKGDITDPNHTYVLTTYFDGQAVAQPYTLSTIEYPDKAVIKGLDAGNMTLMFDTENIAALGDNKDKVKASPTLDYSLAAFNVTAYAVNG